MKVGEQKLEIESKQSQIEFESRKKGWVWT